MSGDDPLNNEVSVSAEMTPTGVTAKAKSRFISGIDRLGGNLTEWVNVRLEANTSRRRAKMKGEERLLDAAVQHGIERLGKDAGFAERALQHHFQETLGKHANREAVLDEAIADLRRLPPSDEQASSGADHLDPVLLDRIADYASRASTDALREKWGRVLASEVRSPGQFSLKVLRIVDELEPKTAILFEQLCQFRIDFTLPSTALRKLSAREEAGLVSAGLIIEPGLGHSISMRSIETEDKERLHVFYFDTKAISVPWETGLKSHPIGPGNDIIELVGERLQVPVYPLTEEGAAIASILPYRREDAIQKLAELIKLKIPGTKTYTYNLAKKAFEDD